jgi:uncharacterized protein YndB with AHSA1/START domain
MSKPSIVHETFVIERTFEASPQRVFAAYADVEMRMRWGVPSDDEQIIYSESNFHVGGSDVYRCGSKGDLKYTGHVRYEHIVGDQRIIFVERVSLGDTELCVSLVSWELLPKQRGTLLVLTDQIASLVGSEMIEGAKRGTSAALDNLARKLLA